MKQTTQIHDKILVYKAFESGLITEAVYLTCVAAEHPLEMLQNFIVKDDVDGLWQEYVAAIA